jgi:hypothetical protein
LLKKFLCYIHNIKPEFDPKVRKSIAEELKKISSFGGIGLGFMGSQATAQ